MSHEPVVSPPGDDDVLLRVENVVKYFPVRSSRLFQRQRDFVHAVEGVSLEIRRGQTLGLVGETGCGKSTLARCIMRLYDLTSGTITFDGHDISTLSRRTMRPYRRDMQMIFQDPYGSLNPRRRVGSIIGDPFAIHGTASGQERKKRVQEVMELVGLNPEHYNRFPAEFSGGQRQRIGVARALAFRPKLVICDEPVSALDVSIQAQIINLLADLQKEFGLTYLFIAHDLSVVRHVSDGLRSCTWARSPRSRPPASCGIIPVIPTRTRCCRRCRCRIRTTPISGNGSSSSGTCRPRWRRRPAAGSTRAAPRRRPCVSSRNRSWSPASATARTTGRNVTSPWRTGRTFRWPGPPSAPRSASSETGILADPDASLTGLGSKEES